MGKAAVTSSSESEQSELSISLGKLEARCEDRSRLGVTRRSRLDASISCMTSRGERKDPCINPDNKVACKGESTCNGGCPGVLGGPGFLWMPTRGASGGVADGGVGGCVAGLVGGIALATILASDGKMGSTCGGANTKILGCGG